MTLEYWTLYQANDPEKKWAVRVPTESGRGKVVEFGGRRPVYDENGKLIRYEDYEDFTTHHDIERRERYRTRHQHDRLDDPYAPGFWSMWALWGESSDLDEAFADAVKRAKKILKQNRGTDMRYNPDITAAQQKRIEQHLEKKINSDGRLYTIKEWLEKLRAEGAVLREVQVNKIKDMSRTAFNRASWEEQTAHARKQREAGKVPEYRVQKPDGVFYVVGKIEADYFQSLPSPLHDEQEAESDFPVASDEDLAHLFGRKNPVREQFDFSRYEEHVAGLSDGAIQYAIEDAIDALQYARTWDDGGAGEAKYLDQLSVLRAEQRARER